MRITVLFFIVTEGIITVAHNNKNIKFRSSCKSKRPPHYCKAFYKVWQVHHQQTYLAV